jgi:predicted RNase H-like HicB family nuclease
MNTKLTMIYWKSDRFWLGKLLEHPEIMTQGKAIEELENHCVVSLSHNPSLPQHSNVTAFVIVMS